MINRFRHIIIPAATAFAAAAITVSCIPDSGRQRHYYDDDEDYDSYEAVETEVEAYDEDDAVTGYMRYINLAMESLTKVDSLLQRDPYGKADEISEHLSNYSQYRDHINAMTAEMSDNEHRAMARLNEYDSYIADRLDYFYSDNSATEAADSAAYDYYD